MQKTLALGGLCGGLVLFLWGSLSYLLLPWHRATLERFTDEAAMTQALVAHAPVSGMYILPNPHRQAQGLAEAQRKAAEDEGLTRMINGPFLFASVSLEGTRAMGPALGLTLLGNVVSAALVTWLVLQAAAQAYWRRVRFVLVIALATAMIAHFPSWVWWRFSTGFTLVEFADPLVGWFLAGLVIARVAAPRQA